MVSMCRLVTVTLPIIVFLSCVTRRQSTDFQMSPAELKAKYQCEYYRCSFGPVGFDKPSRAEYAFHVPHNSKGSVSLEITNVPPTDPFCDSINASKVRISVYQDGTMIKELKRPLSNWSHTALGSLSTDLHDVDLFPYCRRAARESPLTTAHTEQGTVTYRPREGIAWPLPQREGLSLDCDDFWLEKGRTYIVVIEVLNSNARALQYTVMLSVTATWLHDNKNITG